MPTQFSFEGALTNAFRAAHFRTFPWVFAGAYALVVVVFVTITGYVSKGAVQEFIQALEALEYANLDQAEPREILAHLLGTMTPLYPVGAVLAVGFWAIWAMFESASQRRYVRDERFSLRFGADEMRMMVVGLLWTLLNLACFLPALLILFDSAPSLFNQALDGESLSSMEGEIFAVALGSLALMLLLFPVYVFFATRLSPCFAMTIKDRRIVFFDAWKVSRGRFWPILGAYLILAIAGGIIASVIDEVFQFGLDRALSGIGNVESGAEVLLLVYSSAFTVPIGVYIFASAFLSALQQHINGGPAAFAARHDPRGGVDDAARMAVFD